MATADLDALSGAVAAAYFPHRLRVRALPARKPVLRSVDLGPVRLARIGWGADSAVESDHPSAWAINVPLGGVLEARVRGREVCSLPGQATVCPPDMTTTMSRWSADCTIIGMRIDRDYLKRELPLLAERSPRQMPGQLDLRSGPGQAWFQLVSSVGSLLVANERLAGDPHVARNLGASLTAALAAACFPAEDDPGRLRPRIVTRVMEAMEADPTREWTAAQLAEAAGVGIRRLQQGFREYAGTTPIQALQDIRLERVHRDLVHSESPTVAEAAYRWGFRHLGRFAAAYREKYGVTPSDTLRG
ncbi:AraC family transcriptional regulator [Amycolatopsis orientalis]|uniref:AraC family transcriptional regulator n=1 Tax=Amycolatopsis orientalis TaxID=31958 RepID=UPI0003A4CA57|nr:AraC family transcriptional regulator [Amycolatopsis orientalis]